MDRKFDCDTYGDQGEDSAPGARWACVVLVHVLWSSRPPLQKNLLRPHTASFSHDILRNLKLAWSSSMAATGLKLEQKHGKSGVRVCRVWREGGRDFIVEWNVSISLLSDCIPAYVSGDNSSIVATDTVKNTVSSGGIGFLIFVTAALIKIVEKPWERVSIDGFKFGSEKRTTEVTVMKEGALSIASGIEGLALLKTTESVKKVLIDTFFGAPKKGVYSPSVQNTLYLMAKAVLNRFPDIESVELRMPNLHFLPVNMSSKDNPSMVKARTIIPLSYWL
ncbi:hypothetical protein ACLOJK_020823 [Asimina triloba]